MSAQPVTAVETDPTAGWTIDDWVRYTSVYRTHTGERTHWQVNIPQSIREWARTESTSEVDDRDDRDEDTSEDHSEQGKVAEAVVAAVCEHEDVNWDWHDGYQTGDLEIGYLTADIKSRIQNKEKYKDLLVGMRSAGDESDIRADTYVQVLLDEDYQTALVTGWAFGHEVRDASEFEKAQTYPTKMVQHDDLRDLNNLF